MNYDRKKLEILRRRNDELEKEVEDAKKELSEYKLSTEGSYEKAKQLIADLEIIKRDWNQSLTEIQELKKQYEWLIHDTKLLHAKEARSAWFSKILNMTGKG